MLWKIACFVNLWFASINIHNITSFYTIVMEISSSRHRKFKKCQQKNLIGLKMTSENYSKQRLTSSFKYSQNFNNKSNIFINCLIFKNKLEIKNKKQSVFYSFG
jgi:hypothetical protein